MSGFTVVSDEEYARLKTCEAEVYELRRSAFELQRNRDMWEEINRNMRRDIVDWTRNKMHRQWRAELAHALGVPLELPVLGVVR